MIDPTPSTLAAITYRTNVDIPTDAVIDLFRSSGINRPLHNPERIGRMLREANLTITAWDGEKLVGIARSLTDFCYCCYLSDLAVRGNYQHRGIGKQLVTLTKQAVGDQTSLLLLAAPAAMDYYPKIGLEKSENAYLIRRKE